MKLEDQMESSYSTEDKEGSKIECKRSMKAVEYKRQEKIIIREDKSREKVRWDNLIHIEMEFYINDFLFREEFLWDKKIKEVNLIKDFCQILLREKIIDENTNELCEVASEFMTRKILEDIKFYEKVNPLEKLKNGIFGSGCGLMNKEHLITINLDLKNENGMILYKDSFEWDIINEDNNPEDFAKQIVVDMKLPIQFEFLISMNIRKQIKEYIFNLICKFTETFVRMKEKEKSKEENQMRIIKGISESVLPERRRNNFSLINTNITNDNITHSTSITTGVTTRGNIFATYNGTSSTLTTVQTAPHIPPVVHIKTFKSYYDNLEDPFPKLNDNLNKPQSNLFDGKLENLLGRKLYRNKPYVCKPEFLKNKYLPNDNINLKIKKEIQIKKKSINGISIKNSNPIRIPLSNGNKNRKSRPNRKRNILHKLSQNLNDNSKIKKTESELDNPHILNCNENSIIINKEILKFSDYFEIIVIEKKQIESYMIDQENLKIEENEKIQKIPEEENNQETIENPNEIKIDEDSENQNENLNLNDLKNDLHEIVSENNQVLINE